MSIARRHISRLALAGIVVLGLTASAPIAAAQDEPAFIPYCFNGATFDVESGQDMLLACGWSATTRGLLVSFLNADVKSYALVDSSGNVVWTLDAAQDDAYWGDLTKIPAADAGVECAQNDVWVVNWHFMLPALPDGTYTLTTTEAFRHPVNDGYHTCSSEGERFPPPSLSSAGPRPTSVVTIVVGGPAPD